MQQTKKNSPKSHTLKRERQRKTSNVRRQKKEESSGVFGVLKKRHSYLEFLESLKKEHIEQATYKKSKRLQDKKSREKSRNYGLHSLRKNAFYS